MIKRTDVGEYEEYVERPGINFSILKHYLKSPLHFEYEFQTYKLPDMLKKEKDEFIFGRAFHLAVLQPELLTEAFAVIDLSKKPQPDKDFRNAENQKWLKLEKEAIKNSGKACLDSNDYESIKCMAQSVRQNKTASAVLRGATIESPIFWTDEDTGVKCKAIPDIDNKRLRTIVDLKGVADASKYGFRKLMQNQKYYVQIPFYADGLEHIDGMKRDNHMFIAVEKEPPYACAVYDLEDYTVSMGRKVYKGLLAAHRDCLVNQEWKGYEVYSANEHGIIPIGINDAEANMLENHPLLIKHATE